MVSRRLLGEFARFVPGRCTRAAQAIQKRYIVRSAPFRCGCRPIPRGHPLARGSRSPTSGSARLRRFALSRTRGPPPRRVWAVDGSLGGGGSRRPSLSFSADPQVLVPCSPAAGSSLCTCTPSPALTLVSPLPCKAGSPHAEAEWKEEIDAHFLKQVRFPFSQVGHGVHVLDPVFRRYFVSDKLKQLVHDLGWKDPVVPQSMYIFKQAKIGGEVTAHQDSTFLYTTPRQSCLGLWLALQPATLNNGCMWVRPGSHAEPVRRVFMRNPEHFGEPGVREPDKTKPQMVFRETEEGSKVSWEGKLPENSWPPPCDGLFEAGFIPVECAAGDLLVFPGTLDHLS